MNTKKIILIVALIAVVGGLGYYFTKKNKSLEGTAEEGATEGGTNLNAKAREILISLATPKNAVDSIKANFYNLRKMTDSELQSHWKANFSSRSFYKPFPEMFIDGNHYIGWLSIQWSYAKLGISQSIINADRAIFKKQYLA